MAIRYETVGLADARVQAFLAAAIDTSNRWRSKICLDKNPWGKTRLRVHRAADGRYFVRCGLRGSGRSYLSDRCAITTITVASHLSDIPGADDQTVLFAFYLEICERDAVRAAA